MVAELKYINHASSNEHLKIGKKCEKRGYFAPSNGHHRRRGDGGGLTFFLETHFFMHYNIPKFGAIFSRFFETFAKKVKILKPTSLEN